MLKKHPKKLTLTAALIGAAFYFLWPGLDPDLSTPIKLYIQHTASYGNKQANANVVGIEPFMEPLDYATADRFEAKLNGYFKEANNKGWFGENTIVLLPEHLGTWLIATDQKNRTYEAKTTFAAMRPIVIANLRLFLKNYFIFDDPDNISAAIIRAKTPHTAKVVRQIYGKLANKYGVTIIAGSQALMTPGIYSDSLNYGHGPIFNSSFVFGPNGTPQIDAIRKIHPIPSETGFTTAASAEFLPTFEIANHKYGVLICADTWFDDAVSSLASQGVDLLLVPSFLEGTKWNQPWQGYLNDAPVDNHWRQDMGILTEGEAWVKYALPAKAKKYGVRWGMAVFLKGNLWDMKGYGRALIVENGKTHIGTNDHTGAAIYNLWLE